MMADSTSTIPNLSPNSDYALNGFLLEIGNEITDEELDNLKFLVSGEYGFTKRALEKIKKPIHLFSAMRERGFLNSNNLITLQSMLWHIGKRNLHAKYVEFAETLSAPYFVVPNDTPENGYKYVPFHIKGKSLSQLNRSNLEDLRMKVAEIMRVPPQFIIIAGIQASNSLLITFMVPGEYAHYLKDCKSEHIPILQLLSVDSWTVGDTTVTVKDDHMETKMQHSPSRSRQMDREVQNAIERYRQIQEALDKKEEEFERFKLNGWFAAIFFQAKAFLDRYNLHIEGKKQYEKIYCNYVASLKETSVFAYFRYMLKTVRKKSYDEDIISALLEAHSLVSLWHKKQRTDIIIMDLQNQIQTLLLLLRNQQVAHTMLKWERDKLKFYIGIGEKHKILSAREEFFLSMISGGFKITGEWLSNECLEYVFRNLGHDITKSNLKVLLRETTLSGKELEESKHSAYELLKNTFQQKQRQLGEQSGGMINFDQFLRDLLKPLKKPDLEQKAQQYINAFNEKMLKQAQASTMIPESQSQQRTTRQRTQFSDSASTKREESRQTPVEERLSKIEDTLGRLEKFLSGSNPKTEYSPLEKYESMLEASGLKSQYKGLLQDIYTAK